MKNPVVDVLIPTCNRPAALALTLGTLAAQTLRPMRIVISDQGEAQNAYASGEVRAALRFLEALGHHVETHRHLPRRGLAEQRQFLFDQTCAPYALFLDDDVLLEADLVARLLSAILEARCGFVGSALIGLSYVDDVRPREQAIEFWDTPVHAERITPQDAAWQRHRLHNAANLWHVQRRLGLAPGTQRLYKVAWVGGCVLYDAAKLASCGAFRFWRQLPREHCGEDVLAQLRVMAGFGGCAILPSGAYHQELPTTVVDRRVDAPRVLPLRH